MARDFWEGSGFVSLARSRGMGHVTNIYVVARKKRHAIVRSTGDVVKIARLYDPGFCILSMAWRILALGGVCSMGRCIGVRPLWLLSYKRRDNFCVR